MTSQLTVALRAAAAGTGLIISHGTFLPGLRDKDEKGSLPQSSASAITPDHADSSPRVINLQPLS